MIIANNVHRASQFLASRTILLVAIAVFLSCSPVLSDPVTQAQAENAVTAWLAMDSSPLDTALGTQTKDVQSFTDEQGNIAYFVVYLNPSGFVVVSADDLIEPIIAFAPAGVYDPSPDNPLGALVTKDVPSRLQEINEALAQDAELWRTLAAQNGISAARDKWESLLAPRIEAAPLSVTGLSSLSDERVSPLVSSQWDQQGDRGCGSDTYNYYTPNNYPDGCVATAMAQLMRYWQYPTVGVGTGQKTTKLCGYPESRSLRGGNGSGGPYNWSSMPLDPYCPTLTERQAIGALCYDAGVSVNMNYCDGGSSANTLDAANAFKNTFRYSNANRGYNSGSDLPAEQRNRMINSNLHAGYPVILGITGAAGGHAVVCDGYGYNTSTMYHHLNLGWSGSSTAWYNLPNINSSIPFNSVYKCVYNVFTSGTGEIIAGRVTDSSGNPVSGATVKAGSATDTTDSKGIYGLRVGSGTAYAVSVTKSGYTFTSQSVTTGTSTDNTTTCGNKWPINFLGTYASTSTALTVNGATVSGSISPVGDVDWYRFTASSAGTYQIETWAGTLTDNYMYLYGPNSQTTLLEEDDDDGVENAAKILRVLSAGTYFVKVKAYIASSTGTYTIRVTTVASGPSVISLAINSGTSSTTSRSVTLNNNCAGSPTWYMASESSSFSGVSWLTYSTAPAFTLSSGNGTKTVYFKLKNAAGQASSPVSDTIMLNEPIVTLTANVTLASGSISSVGDVDWYKFTVPTSGTYQIITLAGTLIDNYMYLYGPNNQTTQIEADDDDGDGYMAMIIRHPLSPGTYYVKVTGYGSATGTYRIGLSAPGTVQGNISSVGDVDWHWFTISTPGTRAIRTWSGTLTDNYMYLFMLDQSNKWALIEEDNNDGDGNMAMISRTFSPGKYCAGVRAYNSSFTGTYTLGITY